MPIGSVHSTLETATTAALKLAARLRGHRFVVARDDREPVTWRVITLPGRQPPPRRLLDFEVVVDATAVTEAQLTLNVEAA